MRDLTSRKFIDLEAGDFLVDEGLQGQVFCWLVLQKRIEKNLFHITWFTNQENNRTRSFFVLLTTFACKESYEFSNSVKLLHRPNSPRKSGKLNPP